MFKHDSVFTFKEAMWEESFIYQSKLMHKKVTIFLRIFAEKFNEFMLAFVSH